MQRQYGEISLYVMAIQTVLRGFTSRLKIHRQEPREAQPVHNPQISALFKVYADPVSLELQVDVWSNSFSSCSGLASASSIAVNLPAPEQHVR
jgi:hypothetical protein